MKKIYFLMVVVFLGLCVAGIVVSGASIAWFISPASLIIVVGPALTLSLSNFTPSEIFRFYSIGFSKAGGSVSELKNGIAYFNALQSYLIVSGLIGTLIGVIVILATIVEPSRMTRGLSASGSKKEGLL